MAKTITASGNKLNIKNPNAMHGIFQLMLCFGLGLLLFFQFPYIMKIYRSLEWITFDQRSLLQNLSYWVYLAVFLIFYLLGLTQAIKLLFAGFYSIISFYVPPGIPGNLDNLQSMLDLLENRNISGFQDPNNMQKVSRFFTGRFIFLTKKPVEILTSTVDFIRGWIFWLIVFAAPFLARDYLVNYIHFSYPFPWLLFMAVANIALVYIVSAFSLTAKVPEIEVVERKASFAYQGHPENFFNFVDQKLDGLRRQNFQNRVYEKKFPMKYSINMGETNSFAGLYLMENQPMPLVQKFKFTAMIMDFGGVVLQFLAFLAIFIVSIDLMSRPSIPLDGIMYFLPGLIVTIIAINLSRSHGRNFMNLAAELFNHYNFESDLIYLKFTGTCSASEIRVGDGRGGMIVPKRSVIQSENYLTIYASRIITETDGLQPNSQRRLVSTADSAEFKENIDLFLTALTSFRDSSGDLPTINFDNLDNQQIFNTNIAITARMEAAKTQARIVARKNIESGGNSAVNLLDVTPRPAQITEEDNKTCPDCAEKVKSQARKCRFCGYIFNDDGPEINGQAEPCEE